MMLDPFRPDDYDGPPPRWYEYVVAWLICSAIVFAAIKVAT